MNLNFSETTSMIFPVSNKNKTLNQLPPRQTQIPHAMSTWMPKSQFNIPRGCSFQASHTGQSQTLHTMPKWMQDSKLNPEKVPYNKFQEVHIVQSQTQQTMLTWMQESQLKAQRAPINTMQLQNKTMTPKFTQPMQQQIPNMTPTAIPYNNHSTIVPENDINDRRNIPSPYRGSYQYSIIASSRNVHHGGGVAIIRSEEKLPKFNQERQTDVNRKCYENRSQEQKIENVDLKENFIDKYIFDKDFFSREIATELFDIYVNGKRHSYCTY